jgi:hypothetical protein
LDILTEEKLPVTRHQGRIAYFEGLRLRQEADTHPTRSQVLAGVEGGVSGSLAGVDAGVEPSLDIHQRELRELSPKPFKENEEKNKHEDYLPDKRERSDLEINIEEGLLPSTPATPAKPALAKNTTPAPTPAKLPQPLPSTPAIKHRHKEFKVGDRVVIAEVDNLHQGQHGEVIHVGYGSRETDYIVKLDKESRGSKQVCVTVPKGSKLMFLMKL